MEQDGPRLVRMPTQTKWLEELAAFVSVVDANGFSAAARSMRARKGTLIHHVQSLEKRLGVSLMVRTTRSLRVTDEGRAYMEHARRAIAAARDAEAAVGLSRSRPTGLLRVTTPASLAALLMDEFIPHYLAKCPGVSLQLDTSVRTIDLHREGFDVAVRAGPLADSDLRTRHLGSTSAGYYASPRYLARRGSPSQPEDLLQHDTIVIRREGIVIAWPFEHDSSRRTVVITPRLAVGSFALAAQGAAAGLGVVRSPDYFARPFVATGQLVPVLADWTPPAVDVSAIFPAQGTLVPKTRVFVDMLGRWYKRS
ncbi:MAG: hypothetical protein JWN04_4984 [Myxococcaceae bacterium]|nr:hypothetical protein [Myxococcaceae bacterium]